MGALTIPANLAEASTRDPSPERRDWVAVLPGIVADIAQRWSLEVGEPFQPGGQCSWVAPVRDRTGRDLVLKVGWLHYESRHEADGLRLWNGDGAVLLERSEVFGETSALLLEPCVPGVALSECAPGPEQDEVVAALLRRLWVTPPDGHPFRPLQQLSDAWADEFEARIDAAPETVDPGLAREGMALFRALPSSAHRCVVLCTDLHAENILSSQREPWLVIDPKPYVGDPCYDVLQHLITDRDRLTRDPLGRAGRMADLLGLDRDRLAAWLFARCVQESIEFPWLRQVAARIAPA